MNPFRIIGDCFAQERERWLLWASVGVGLGIVLFRLAVRAAGVAAGNHTHFNANHGCRAAFVDSVLDAGRGAVLRAGLQRGTD